MWDMVIHVREQHGTQPIILHFCSLFKFSSVGVNQVGTFKNSTCSFTGASKAHRLSTTTAKSSQSLWKLTIFLAETSLSFSLALAVSRLSGFCWLGSQLCVVAAYTCGTWWYSFTFLQSCSLFKFSLNQGVETGAEELISEESKSDTSHLGFPHYKMLQGIYIYIYIYLPCPWRHV